MNGRVHCRNSVNSMLKGSIVLIDNFDYSALRIKKVLKCSCMNPEYIDSIPKVEKNSSFILHFKHNKIKSSILKIIGTTLLDL